MRRIICQYLIAVGTTENSLDSARWGVAIGKSNKDLSAAYINAFAFFVRVGSEPQNSRLYRSMLRVQASNIFKIAHVRNPLSLRRVRARRTLKE